MTTDLNHPATEYAFANPTLRPEQLRQLYPMTPLESQMIMRRARRNAAKETMPRKPFGGVSISARAMSEERKARLAEAIAYAIANPNEYATTIAERYRVPSPPITEALAAERKRLAGEKPPRKRRNRLMGWVDGELVDLRTMRDFSKVTRFEGCKV